MSIFGKKGRKCYYYTEKGNKSKRQMKKKGNYYVTDYTAKYS